MITQQRKTALAAFLVISMASAATADDFASKASSAFSPAVEEYDIPGLVVGVTRNGEHEFYTTGLASRADNVPVTADTLFELGSISKIFNVTLAALAEERGKLSLDDTVARHLCSDACSIGDGLTLMDLATHRSGGLPLQVPDGIADVDQLVDWLKEWQPSQPGARSYSNISIGMLGYISANALGTDYTQAAQTLLFPAFGLQSTFIDVPAEAMDRCAFGYERKTDKPIRVTLGILDAEAYGVKSSARDMLRVLDVELGRAEASEELKAAVARTQQGQVQTAKYTQNMIWEQYPWPADLETMVAGNGSDFIMKPQPSEKIVPAQAPRTDVILNKTGSTNGFGGYVVMVPSEGLGIVVLANRNYPNEARVRATYALIDALIEK